MVSGFFLVSSGRMSVHMPSISSLLCPLYSEASLGATVAHMMFHHGPVHGPVHIPRTAILTLIIIQVCGDLEDC